MLSLRSRSDALRTSAVLPMRLLASPGIRIAHGYRSWGHPLQTTLGRSLHAVLFGEPRDLPA